MELTYSTQNNHQQNKFQNTCEKYIITKNNKMNIKTHKISVLFNPGYLIIKIYVKAIYICQTQVCLLIWILKNELKK